MSIFKKLLRIIRFLSLDIAAGAAAVYILVTKISQHEPEPGILLCLIPAVWLIYSADHLMDSFRGNSRITKARYTWHRERSGIILPMLFLMAVLVLLTGIFLLPDHVFRRGMYTGVIVLLYLLLNFYSRRIYIWKEFWIGILYVAGTVLVPFHGELNELGTYQLILFLDLYLLVQANVLIYTWYEYSLDLSEGLMSFAGRFGPRSCGILILMILLLTIPGGFILLVVSQNQNEVIGSIIVLLMSASLLLIRMFPAWFNRADRYGIFADLSFLIPLVILLP